MSNLIEKTNHLLEVAQRVQAKASVSPFWLMVKNDPLVKELLDALADLDAEVKRTAGPPVAGPPVPAPPIQIRQLAGPCLWSGARGCCTKPLGHIGPHEEANEHK